MTAILNRRLLLLGVLTIVAITPGGLRNFRKSVEAHPASVPETRRPSANSNASAASSINYLARVMDQFHNRFAVYDDVSSAGNHFFAWAKTPDGNAQAGINGSFTDNPHSGATAIQCSFLPLPGSMSGGFVFLNGTLTGTQTTPQPNFGTEANAGIDLTGATALTFWARGKQGGEIVEFFVGGVGWHPDTGAVRNPCTPDFSGRCPYPDSTRAIKITRTLTNQWQQFRIDLTNVPLNYVLGGFGWGVSGAENPGVTEFYLDDIQYELNATRLAQRLNEPRLLRSFDTLPFQVQPQPANDFDLVLRNSAFVYDNAVALLAFLADGSADSLRRARLIGDALVYASQHDRAYSDGRLRNDYSAGDISLPPGWSPNGRNGTVPVSGFYDETQKSFIEIEQKSIDTGNNTWAMIALLALYRQNSNPSYLATARALGNFIHTFRNDAGNYRGFQGGLDNYPETPMVTRRVYGSTEHNLDIYAGFTRLAQITGESQWQSDAEHARQFVEAMWDSQKGCYLAGTTNPDTRNQIADQLPLDVQAWSTLALPTTLALHPQVLQCAEDNHRNSNAGFSGFDFNNDRDGVWFEGTAQMATAYAFAVRSASVMALREDLSRAQQTLPFGANGGLAAASREGLSTGFDFKYFVRQHVGATAWNVFAQLGYNPFYQNTATSLQLSSTGYSVTEGTPDIAIVITRSGNTSEACAIDYATVDSAQVNNCNVVTSAASSRCDYLTTLGTLHFASNESSKTILIPIVDDVYVETQETFVITLSSPINTILSSPSSAVVSITDNDTTTGPNPMDSPGSFVRQHYIDFLNREPDQSGSDFWASQITNCGSNAQCIEVQRINVSASFFLSIEFQQTGYMVERFYKVAFGNANGNSTFGGTHQLPVPIIRFDEFLRDSQRIGRGVVVLAPGWEQLLESNKQAYALEFVQTSRFATAFPTTLTPAQFVDQLNLNAGSVLSASERTAAINLFGGAANSSNTTARAQAVRQVAEDADLYNAEYNRAFVLAEYYGYLRRNPNDAPESTLDYTGYDFWLTKLNQFNGNYINAEMVKAFLSSIEYRQRFGP